MPYFRFLAENARWLMGGFLLTFFSSFGQTFFISLSGGAIIKEYGLTNGSWGLLYMIATLGSALTLPFLGRIVDFRSVASTVQLVIPALVLASMVMAFSNSLIVLILVLYCLRLFGQGMMTHIALTAMGRWYAAHRGRAVSIATIGHQAGEAVLPIAVAFLVVLAGWRGSWIIASGFLAVVALPAIYLLMRKERVPLGIAAEGETDSGVKDWTRAQVLADPLFYVLLFAVLAPSFIGTTLFFHQDFLIELRGWDKMTFSLSFSAMAVFTVVFALIAGPAIDRFTAVRLLPLFMFPLALACFAMWYVEQQWGAFVFMVLLGVTYGMSSTLFGALWPEIYGTLHLGAIRSVIIACMVFGTAMGPGITGFLIDIGVDYPLQIMFMGLYCLGASVLMIFVSRQLILRKQSFS